jgi:hypothetical protein
VCQWQAAPFDFGAPNAATALNAGRWRGDPQGASGRRHAAGPAPLLPLGSTWEHRTPSRGKGGPGPPRPVGAGWPVMVWPSHVAAPDLQGEAGSAGVTRELSRPRGRAEAPDLTELGGRVRRPRPQLSGPEVVCHVSQRRGGAWIMRSQGPGHPSRRYPYLYVPTMVLPKRQEGSALMGYSSVLLRHRNDPG